MRNMILIASAMLMFSCASRTKKLSESELQENSSSQSSVTEQLQSVSSGTQQSTESSELQSKASDVSVANDFEIEGVYTGRPDSTGNYTPARFTKVEGRDTIADFVITGPGSFKFRDKSSGSFANSVTDKKERTDAAYKAQQSDTLLYSGDAKEEASKNVAVFKRDETVKQRGTPWWIWLSLVLFLIGLYKIGKQ